MLWPFINLIQAIIVSIWTALWASIGFIIWVLTLGSQKHPMIVSHFWGPGLIWISGSRITVIGKENIVSDKNFIYCANHESLMDIPAVFTAVNVNLYFVAKRELQKIPFLGWFMTMVGMIFIDRGNKERAYESMRRAGQLIKGGKNVISFPEGTRNKDGKMRVFKRGSFIMAQAGEISVVPIAIKGAREILPSGKFKMRPGHIIVKIGQPISGECYKENVDAFANAVREKVIEMRNSI